MILKMRKNKLNKIKIFLKYIKRDEYNYNGKRYFPVFYSISICIFHSMLFCSELLWWNNSKTIKTN